MKKKQLIYSWSIQDYIKFVEKSSHPLIRNYEQAELDYLLDNIKSPKNKTFVDIGAGYGRVLPALTKIARSVIGVEINDEMFQELQKRTAKFSNAVAVKGDANKLSNILTGCDLVNPVLVCLQNSIGTWEGDYKKAIEEMGKVAEEKHGEVIISAWRGELFKDYATKIYSAISFVGEPDLERTNFDKGIYVSKSGYKVYWWSPEQRKEILSMLGGKKVNEALGTPFFILHAAYN